MFDSRNHKLGKDQNFNSKLTTDHFSNTITMSKIIIEIQDDTDPAFALFKISQVVRAGRVSEGRGINHFCWHTEFSDGLVVNARQKKSIKSADSFVVWTK